MHATSPPPPTPVRIGALAAAAGVSVQALRYYERRGLIAPTGRRHSGYREYDPRTADDVRFIRHAQRMGFELKEIGELLRLRHRVAAGRPRGRDAVRDAVLAKLATVNRRLRDLEAIRETLEELLAICDRLCSGDDPPEECPIFEAIDHAEAPGSIAPAPRTTRRGGGRARSATLHHPSKGGP